MTKIKNIFRFFLIGLLMFSIFFCKESLNSNLRLERNSKTIMVYLKSNPAYSNLVEALVKTGLSETLNLYGTVTLFAPTNDAFKKLLARRKVASVADMKVEDLTTILNYHLYAKSYTSSYFISGSLGSTTIEGDFIQMDITSGVKSTILNGSVKVDSLDIPVTNGVVHVINDVLEPPVLTLYAWLKTQPQYSVMVEAFEKTGNDTSILNKVVYDPLNLNAGKPTIKWRTVFLETNDVLKNAGINSFDDLAKKYSNTYNSTKTYSNLADSLNLFVRYHSLERKYFLSDVRNDYIETFNKGAFLIFSTKPSITINSRKVVSKITLNPITGKNDTVFTYPKVTMTLAQSNRIAKNGVVHTLESVLSIYNPSAVLLVSLFAGAPEDRLISLPSGETKNITDLFDPLNGDPIGQSAVWWLKWEGNMTGIITAAWPANVFLDYCVVVNSNSSAYSIELTTKPVFKGTYSIWITCRRTANLNYFVQYSWDNQKLGDLIDMTKSPDVYGNAVCGTDCKNIRQIGIKKFTEMASHKFKLYLPNPGTNYTAWYTLELRPI
ncbi:MAG: fasciclin domain-containing protein [Mariniphaga sp.]